MMHHFSISGAEPEKKTVTKKIKKKVTTKKVVDNITIRSMDLSLNGILEYDMQDKHEETVEVFNPPPLLAGVLG